MYSKDLVIENSYLMKESLNNVIDFITGSIEKLKRGEINKVGIDDAKKILKDITFYSQPLKQIFGEYEYRKLIRTIVNTSNIKNHLRSAKTVNEDVNPPSLVNTIKEIINDKNFTWIDKIKLIILEITMSFSYQLKKAVDKLSNENVVDTSGDKTSVSLRFKTSVEKYLDRFFDKLNQNNILSKNRRIVTNIMFVITFALGLAITNIGLKMVGYDLNQVKSFGDFLRIIKDGIKKGHTNIFSVLLIIVGLIIFFYSLYVILRKTVVFILDKLSMFLFTQSAVKSIQIGSKKLK